MPTQNADSSRTWLQGAFKQVLGLSPLDLRRMGTPEDLPIERARQIFEQLEGKAVRLPERRLPGALDGQFQGEAGEIRSLAAKLEPLIDPESQSEIDAFRSLLDTELSDLVDAFSADEPPLGLNDLFDSITADLERFQEAAGLTIGNVVTEADAQKFSLVDELNNRIRCLRNSWSTHQQEPDSTRDLARIVKTADCVQEDVDKIWDQLDEAGYDRECLKLHDLDFASDPSLDPAQRPANVYAVIDTLGRNARRVITLAETSGTVAARAIRATASHSLGILELLLPPAADRREEPEEIDPRKTDEIFQQALERGRIQQKPGGRFYAGRQELCPGVRGKPKVMAALRKQPDRLQQVVAIRRKKPVKDESERPFFYREGLEAVLKLLQGVQARMTEIHTIAEMIAARRG